MSAVAIAKLDPRALRKPGATGVPILLADGQEWLCRRPVPIWTPDDNEDGLDMAFDLGPEYDALYGTYEEQGSVASLAALMRFLLVANYDLDTAALKQILRMDFRPTPKGEVETDGARIVRELRDLILGRVDAPKA